MTNPRKTQKIVLLTVNPRKKQKRLLQSPPKRRSEPAEKVLSKYNVFYSVINACSSNLNLHLQHHKVTTAVNAVALPLQTHNLALNAVMCGMQSAGLEFYQNKKTTLGRAWIVYVQPCVLVHCARFLRIKWSKYWDTEKWVRLR